MDPLLLPLLPLEALLLLLPLLPLEPLLLLLPPLLPLEPLLLLLPLLEPLVPASVALLAEDDQQADDDAIAAPEITASAVPTTV